MLTYDDYLETPDVDKSDWILRAIKYHQGTELYKKAVTADLYNRQKNVAINNLMPILYDSMGIPRYDFTASNAKIASDFFRRCCTQRCTYSLGNGVSFTQHIRKDKDPETGLEISVDETKERLGPDFDPDLYRTAYAGLSEGLSFGYKNGDRMVTFEITEAVPLWDLRSGTLQALIRYVQPEAGMDNQKRPMIVEFYEPDGVTEYQTTDKDKLAQTAEKKPYKVKSTKAPADTEATVTGENYNGRLPIIPFWGSKLHQSLLVGKQQTIDYYDLVRSGFVDNVQDCAKVYTVLSGYGGSNDPKELEKIRDQMRLLGIVAAEDGAITQHTQDVPYQATKECLDGLRAQIYEDFCCLDVHTIAAGATNDHIDAAYQPMDDAADDFEYQIIKFVQDYLALDGVEDTPTFKRNKISNQKEQTEMVLLAANYLDEETVLSKLPFISPDEVPGIIARKDAEGESRFAEEQEEVEVIE